MELGVGCDYPGLGHNFVGLMEIKAKVEEGCGVRMRSMLVLP